LSQFSEFIFAFGIFVGAAMFLINNIISKKCIISNKSDALILKPIYDTYKVLTSLYGLSFVATTLYLQFISIKTI